MAFPIGWTRKCPLVIQHTQVTANQTALPVLITEASLPDDMLTLSGSSAAQSDGGDIRFSSDSAGAAQLPCEVVVWSQNATPASAKAEIWVPVNVSSTVDVTIYVWYKAGGGLSQPGAGTTYGSQAVWDSHYLAVYHFGDGSSLSVNDSTANAKHGTNHSGAAVAGKIGGGVSFDATTKYITLPSGAAPSGSAQRAFEGWIKTSDTGTKVLFDQGSVAGGQRWLIYTPSGTDYITCDINGGSGHGSASVRAGSWKHWAAVQPPSSGNSLAVYVNGSPDSMGFSVSGIDTGSMSTGASPIYLNSNVDGNTVGEIADYDEFRISDIVRSATWISTTYNNQSAPGSFVIDGSVDSIISQRGNIDYDQIKAAARSGSGTKLLTTTGSLTPGNLLVSDTDGNAVDGGSPGGGSGTVTHTGGALTADQPVFGAGSDDVVVGTKTGNTNKVATADTSTKTSGNYPKWDASGNLTGGDSGGGAGGALALLESHTAVSGTDSELNFTAWYSSSYGVYVIEFEGIIPSTTGLTIGIQCSTNGGSSYDTGSNYNYSHFVWSKDGSAVGGGNSQTQFLFFPYAGRTLPTGSSYTLNGTIKLHNPGGANYKNFLGMMLGNDNVNSANAQRVDVAAWYLSTSAVDAFRVKISSGTFGGTVRVYGIAK